jgi:protein tyrosine phosphatase (PTP) superfamily phosphohydrolase (DUF442 family)
MPVRARPDRKRARSASTASTNASAALPAPSAGRTAGVGRRWLRPIVAVLLACVLGALGRRVVDNFHTVIPGLVYRSGQLGPGKLAGYLDTYRIRSVVNLRGAHPEEEWYQEERAATGRCGVRLYDVSVDSHAPSPAERVRLARILELCEKPVLIHCNAGIDRTGLAAGISVLLLDEGGSVERARDQLSWWFGDLGWRDHRAQQEAFFQRYARWLAHHKVDHEPERFLEWLLRTAETGRTEQWPGNLLTQPGWPGWEPSQFLTGYFP